MKSQNWDDLTVRLISSVAMTAVGAVGVIAGGVWFQMLVVFVTAVMVWELWTMIAPDRPTPGMLMAALTASVMSGQLTLVGSWPLLMFLIVPVVGASQIKIERRAFFLFALAIPVAGYGLLHFRAEYGFVWLLWLMSVVIATDVFGYFAGRTFGGPKFWPSISPKKTWSGTVAGWISAAIVGLIFVALTNAGAVIVLMSVVISFAGQMGDIAESALKRRVGVKDSSTLIPGHGGLFDRFDALLGAALFMVIIISLINVPGVSF
ncbi:phosphatidate cytidylyltransferase [Yoonia sp. MH D7]